jgi:hypothetical protein
MEVRPVFLTSTNIDSFREGMLAQIIGVRNVRPSPRLEFRMCYQVAYEDGVIDFVAIEDSENYVITTAK